MVHINIRISEEYKRCKKKLKILPQERMAINSSVFPFTLLSIFTFIFSKHTHIALLLARKLTRDRAES